jgi:hypothetical protein
MHRSVTSRYISIRDHVKIYLERDSLVSLPLRHLGEPRAGLLRLTVMSRLSCRLAMGWAALVVTVGTVAACGGAGSARSAVPAEFRAACGHPGAQVTVKKVPVTVSHAECDLTGVTISYRNYGGATVPSGGGGTGIGTSSGFTLTIHPGTLDVTVNATGVPGNG